MKAMELEMEAMKADKVMKDEQLFIVERERRLAEKATQKNKGVIDETQEAGGSSNQVDVEMVEAEADPQGFVLVEEVEEEEERTLDDDLFEIDNFPEGNDDDDHDHDHGTTGLLIVNPNVAQRIDDFLNDAIKEQEDDDHQEASTSGNQHANQVFLTQPTVIFLNAPVEGELEIPRSRAEMLEELGLDDGKFKFNIEEEISQSPEREYESVYVAEADKYDEVLVEDASDSSDEETDFHYSGIDESFPSLAEMFKD
ncbi:hypothetical protein Hanom_Chr01g00046031 [Helianthus anomalus]